MFFIFYALGYLAARIVICVIRSRDLKTAGKGGPHMITLNLRFPRPMARKTLCTGCIYSHVVRGFDPREELIFCGYAFPQREVPFPVRECTDFRAERVEAGELATVAI